jgi:hypothetical protein
MTEFDCRNYQGHKARPEIYFRDKPKDNSPESRYQNIDRYGDIYNARVLLPNDLNQPAL